MRDDKEIDYVARHYRAGRFDAGRALRHILPRRRWSPARVAAAAALAVVLSATAAVAVHYARTAPAATELPAPAPTADVRRVTVMDFEDAPLTEVAGRIRQIYGVELTGLPADSSERRLSLHYEGTAAELVETVNELLDTDIRIEEP